MIAIARKSWFVRGDKIVALHVRALAEAARAHAAHVLDLVEDDQLFLLVHAAPRSYTVVPKRAFESEASQAQFRERITSSSA